MNIKSIVLFLLCCLAPTSFMEARELILTERAISRKKPKPFFKDIKGWRKKNITIKYETPKAKTMAEKLIEQAKILQKKEEFADDLDDKIKTLEIELAKTKEKAEEVPKLREENKRLEAQVEELEKAKKTFMKAGISSVDDYEKLKEELDKKLVKTKGGIEALKEDIAKVGAPPPPVVAMEGVGVPPPPPIGMPEMRSTKKPTKESTKPKLPAVLEEAKMKSLSEKEKKASDQLFFEVLREISQANHQYGVDNFQNQFDFLKKKLFIDVRKNNKFKKRTEFDTLFGKKERGHGSFKKDMGEKIKKPAEEKLNEFLDKMYAEFTSPDDGELLKYVKEQLGLCLFDDKKVDDERDYVVTMLINFIVSLRKKTSRKFMSDSAASQVFKDFKNKKGRFLDKDKPIKQLEHEIDFLRLNKDFLKFDYVIGEMAVQRYKGAPTITKDSLNPLLIVMRYSDFDEKNFDENNFIKMLSAQLFFQPQEFLVDMLEEAGLNKLKEDLNSYKLSRKAAQGTLDLFDVLEKKFKKKNNLKGVLSALDMFKRAIKYKKDETNKIIEIIKEQKNIDTIIKKVASLVDKKKLPGDFETRLRKIITVDRKRKEITTPIITLFKEIDDGVDESAKIDKLLYEGLKEIKDIDLNQLDKVFKGTFRTPLTVEKFFVQYFPPEEGKNVRERTYFLKKITPYGHLLMLLREIPKMSKKPMKDKSALIYDVARSLNQAKMYIKVADFKDAFHPIITSNYTYKNQLKNLVENLRSLDLQGIGESIREFVVLAGVDIEKTDEYKAIIAGVIKIVIEEAKNKISDKLEVLNKTNQKFEEDYIIPELKTERVHRNLIILHSMVFDIFKNMFGKVIKLNKVYIDKINITSITNEFSELKKNIMDKINKIEEKYAKGQRKRLINTMNSFLDGELEKIKKIKEAFDKAK